MERDTRQRRAIREAIEAADRPLAPQEILHRAHLDVPRLGIATVYRTVKALVEEGWAQPVELPEGPVRYERTGKGHHHHFVCRSCEGVFEVAGCPRGVGALTPAGFHLESHDLVLYGRCERCVA
jgi:Fur family transcriptional regulator, ferric uptake regulator